MSGENTLRFHPSHNVERADLFSVPKRLCSFPMKNNMLIFPGLGGSGPQHWQTIWEKNDPDFVRIEQKNWDNPIPKEWEEVLDDYVRRSGPDTIVIAHSLACAVLVNWAQNTSLKIKGALLVAPADVERC